MQAPSSLSPEQKATLLHYGKPAVPVLPRVKHGAPKPGVKRELDG